MFRHTIIVGAAMTAMMGGAHGADPMAIAPEYGFSPEVPSIHDWSGFYGGLNVGFGWGEAYDDAGVLNPPFPGTYDAVDGAFGGAQFGYNLQMDGFVFGVEADIQVSGMSQAFEFFPGGDAIVGIDYFGTVRGRAGVAIESFMPYLTAGLAYGRGRIDASGVGGPIETRNHTGWVAGGGVEYAVDDNISLKAEYLYADLGQQDYPVFPGIGGEGLRFHAVRVGVNYGF